MAIDTAAKRASVLSFAFVANLLIVPVAGIAQADQQTICHCYRGIAATQAFSRPSARSGPRLALAAPSAQYDPQHEAQVRAAIMREDGNNLKRGQDVDVGGAKFILTASDGTRFKVTVSSAGVISAVAI